jgi:hypothetical protein
LDRRVRLDRCGFHLGGTKTAAIVSGGAACVKRGGGRGA